MIPRKFLIWKYRRKGRWLAMVPGSLKVHDFPTWAAAMGFVDTMITGRQRGRR